MVLRNSFCFVIIVFSDAVNVSDITSTLYLVILSEVLFGGWCDCLTSDG